MIEHPNVIPIAVVVAICIFLAKEVLEFVRRHRLNARKMHAIRRFLAVECERNSFAIQKMIEQIRATDEAHESGWPIALEKEGSFDRLVINPAGKGHSSAIVRPVHTDAVQKYLFEVASLDGAVFEMMEKTLDTLIEANDRQHLGGFAGYAIEELDEALDAVRALYFKCTNDPLAQGRVR